MLNSFYKVAFIWHCNEVGTGYVIGLFFFFFFFQAEDGIRDRTVTGVQTCALPILQDDLAGPGGEDLAHRLSDVLRITGGRTGLVHLVIVGARGGLPRRGAMESVRSEERRVGKECGCRGWGGDEKEDAVVREVSGGV